MIYGPCYVGAVVAALGGNDRIQVLEGARLLPGLRVARLLVPLHLRKLRVKTPTATRRTD